MSVVPTFVAFKWKSDRTYRSIFGPDTVIALQRMIAKHYAKPHRFVCVTDDTTDLKGIETIPLWDDYASLPSPNGKHNPSCYRRLKLFAPDAGVLFGERVIAMDLDTVIVRDIAPIVDRSEDFIIWGETDFPRRQWYNGSLWSLRTGSRPQVWTKFDPKTSPKMAAKAGARGSDQGWISYILGPGQPTWGREDGIYSWRKHLLPKGGDLPADARIVAFHGHRDPWGYEAQHFPWIREHWGVAA